ncbi:hypothetical protein Tsubulata_027251 [Turnera subulata]|uniref:Uncharacterized protein n=1 Tax=Turnera subulata TaxID=218843 RepID=A0A9Q0F153_9ROSI|nr:hypothetical protein Tsubulata_027251 [Turnera subulata]
MDLGFLWFREFYLESSRVIQFPIECSLPWMLVEHVLDSQNAGLLESVLLPFDIYNDSAQQSLSVLRQCFLYDEIEAEVDHCFDIFVSKLCEIIFTYYKSWAASELLDPSFLFALDNGEKYSVQPMRFTSLFKMTRVKVWSEMQSDFLPNFVLCNTTQHFVRSSRVPLVPVQKPSFLHAKPNFYCGAEELNSAHQSYTRLHGGFFGIPHMFSIVRLLGSRSLPWLIRALLDHISNKACHAFER